jgi:hypothetical protein
MLSTDTGRLKTKLCISSQARSRRNASCSVVSTPGNYCQLHGLAQPNDGIRNCFIVGVHWQPFDRECLSARAQASSSLRR